MQAKPIPHSALRTPYSNDGQILLIGVLIIFILVLSIPAMIFLNQHATSHGVVSQKKLRARAVAEEGIAYAIQKITASGGATCDVLFDGNTLFKGAQGGAYTLLCGFGQESYQLALVANPRDILLNPTNPPVIPGSSVQTIVSKQTVGVKLPNGLNAAAALDIAATPTIRGVLDVERGPIICRATQNNLTDPVWTLDGTSVGFHRPRKFSAGAINYPPTTTLTSDQKEYWTHVSPGFANVIDLKSRPTSYLTAASLGVCPVLPGCEAKAPNTSCTAVRIPVPGSGVGNCAFQSSNSPSHDSLVFDTGAGGFQCNNSPCIIYVNGNATLKEFQMDFHWGAFVLDGDTPILTLAPHSDTAGPYNPPTPVRDPPTTALEDPLSNCRNRANYETNEPPCWGPTTRRIDINEGFVYVAGNPVGAIVATDTDVNSYWTIDGVVRSDGGLVVGNNVHLLIFYNDMVSVKIHTSNFELKVDSTTAVP